MDKLRDNYPGMRKERENIEKIFPPFLTLPFPRGYIIYMDIILTALCALNFILLIVVIVRQSSSKKADELNEASLLHVRDELRESSEASFRSFQSSYDRDMTKLLSDIRTLSADTGVKISSMTKTLNDLSSELLRLSGEESEKAAVRSQSVQNTLNHNFDRIREDNRASFALITEKSEKLTAEVKGGMDRIREGNEARLKDIQAVVDQKLQETLDKRITASFEAVTENLSKLYKAMGTLDTLSGDVRKMNALFSNVKSRGVWGEMQAETILSDILTPEQWVKNYSPRKNAEKVEFAVRLPGKENGEIFLPIDSKFPVADYERYRAAVDSGDREAVEIEMKNMKRVIENEAKTINRLYVVPPETTDFALLFLPSEALYLEVLKIDGLVEKLQNEWRVVITGPNNFAALLNSLSLGFKTMQIEAYTSTIWHLFEDLKKLFGDLSKSVDDSKRSVDKAQESLEKAKARKEKIASVLTKMESSAEKAAISEIREYYIEENSGNGGEEFPQLQN